MAAFTPSRDRNEYGLFLFFDNSEILLSTVSSFEERCNNLSFEEVDQAADRLRTAAETIQLHTEDIGNNEDFTDVTSILNLSLIKVRNLIDQLQQYRNEMLDFFGERAYSSSPDSSRNGPGRPPYVNEEKQKRFLREIHFSFHTIFYGREGEGYQRSWSSEPRRDSDRRKDK